MKCYELHDEGRVMSGKEYRETRERERCTERRAMSYMMKTELCGGKKTGKRERERCRERRDEV